MKKIIAVLLLALSLSIGAAAYAEDWNPDVEFMTVDAEGNEWTDRAFADARLTMLNLWAYWCPPCVGELPDLQKLSENYPDLQILGVSLEDYEQDNIRTMEELGVSYPTIRLTESLDREMNTGYIPTTIFVNSDGHIVGDVYVGSKTYAQWAAIVEKYLDETQSAQDIIEKLAVCYGTYGSEAGATIETLLGELASRDRNAADRWQRIMNLWASAEEIPIHYDCLPDGLPETDELCIIVLGFQLNPDGTMKDELVERLKVVLASAEKYPNAWIVCTGGGTAAENETATEAGKMAEWLVNNGVDSARVIVEDKSVTTAQNAMFTCEILREQHPQVSQLAIVSSDYHIPTGALLFEAEAILAAEEAGQENMEVVSNAAWEAPSGELSSMFQAGALIELSGDAETAFDIYYETYDIHELPSLAD